MLQVMADYGSPNDAVSDNGDHEANGTPKQYEAASPNSASSHRRSADGTPPDEDYERVLSPRQESPVGTPSHVSGPSSPVSANGDE